MSQDDIYYAFKLEPVGGSVVGVPQKPITAPFRVYKGNNFCCNSAETPEELAIKFTGVFFSCTTSHQLSAVSFKPPYSLAFVAYGGKGGLRAYQVKEFTYEEIVRFSRESQKTLEEIAESKN